MNGVWLRTGSENIVKQWYKAPDSKHTRGFNQAWFNQYMGAPRKSQMFKQNETRTTTRKTKDEQRTSQKLEDTQWFAKTSVHNYEALRLATKFQRVSVCSCSEKTNGHPIGSKEIQQIQITTNNSISWTLFGQNICVIIRMKLARWIIEQLKCMDRSLRFAHREASMRPKSTTKTVQLSSLRREFTAVPWVSTVAPETRVVPGTGADTKHVTGFGICEGRIQNVHYEAKPVNIYMCLYTDRLEEVLYNEVTTRPSKRQTCNEHATELRRT